MRPLALLLMLPSICAAAWVSTPIADPNGGIGFEVYLDDELQYEIPALYTDTHTLFFYADHLVDGFVAGHLQTMQQRGSSWVAWGDPVAITVDRYGFVDLWDVGSPVWMNDKRWACVDGGEPFLMNAESRVRKDLAVRCSSLDPASVPEPAMPTLLGAGISAFGALEAYRRLKARVPLA